MNTNIYFDNASTSFPKPDTVPEMMMNYIKNIGSNINRGCYDTAYHTEEIVFETRELLCDMFAGEDARNVVFTRNITESLNCIIKGLLKPGDHVLVSSMEHNAVMRPLTQLSENGITFNRIHSFEDGTMDFSSIESLIKPNTKAIIMLHASNVCGTMLPVEEVGKLCLEHGLIFVVDTAQTAGIFDIDMNTMHIDALCFTGHKSLLGPQGVGGFIIKNHLVDKLTPLIAGGTGSISHTEDIPPFMPDKFEAGTPNLPGIFGLNASLKWLKEKGINNIRSHELDLTRHMLDELIDFSNSSHLINVVGKQDINGRAPLISITTPMHELAQVANSLDEEYGIQTRVGIHCAPSAHRTLGTYPTGTIRFSFGPANTHDEVDIAVNALKKILKRE